MKEYANRFQLLYVCSKVHEETKRSIGRVVLLISLTIILGSCTTFTSTKDRDEGALFISGIVPILAVANHTMSEVFSNVPIAQYESMENELAYGFSATRTNGLDIYTTTVRFFEGTGVSQENKIVTGYYFEVFGKGTMFSGPSVERKFADKLESELKAQVPWKICTEIRRSKYIQDPDRVVTVIDNQTERRLNELKDLFDKNLITEEEYRKKREEILGEI